MELIDEILAGGIAFPNGRIDAYSSIEGDGVLVHMVFHVAKNLGKALSTLSPNTIHHLDYVDNRQASIFLDAKTALRLAKAKKFDVLNSPDEPTKTCERCKTLTDELVLVGVNNAERNTLAAVCFKCSPFHSPNDDAAGKAARAAIKANRLPAKLPACQTCKKPVGTLYPVAAVWAVLVCLDCSPYRDACTHAEEAAAAAAAQRANRTMRKSTKAKKAVSATLGGPYSLVENATTLPESGNEG